MEKIELKPVIRDNRVIHPLLYSFLKANLVLVIASSVFYISDIMAFGQTTDSLSQDENNQYKIDSLFIALLKNGDASIDFNLNVDPNKTITNITLYGETVQNLTLTDYNESDIRYTPTETSNKITVHSLGSTDIHVTYVTPDLVDKQNRNWTFSVFFRDRFLLNIPSDAHIIHMEPPAFLTPSGDQNLWGFGPGNVQVSYVIGPLGTREEAQVSIRSAEALFKDARTENGGIVLNSSSILLEKARTTFNQNKYLETVTYATQAISAIQDSIKVYNLGKSTITDAENEIQRDTGTDISEANQTLSIAKELFMNGEYEKSIDFATMAVNQSKQNPDQFNSLNSNISPLLLIILIVPILLLVYFIIRKTYVRKEAMKDGLNDASNSYKYQGNDHISNIEKNDDSSSTSETKVRNASPIHPNVIGDSTTQDGLEIKEYLKTVVEEVGNVRKNHVQDDTTKISPTSYYHPGDKEFLSRIVQKMKSEKPHLRGEDRDLLDYLCEKEGSAFESEIRNKFVLPRTSLWRLIKRLEREELVEVRKIGGQNLIKLKFEDN